MNRPAARRHSLTRHVRRSARRGFTLLEIIVVVTIIGLVAAFVAPRLLGNIGNSKVKLATSETASLAAQVQLWMVNNQMSTLPDDFELEILTTGDDRVLKAADILDPWGNPYIVINPGEVNPEFDVMSYGADGVAGGEGENVDITN